MKKMLSIAIAIMMCIAFASCDRRPDAEADLTAFFEAMKAFDTAEIVKYLTDSEFDVNAATAELENMGFDYKLLTKELEYEILECTETDDTAEATVKISNISFADVLPEVMARLMPIVLDPSLLRLETPEYEKAVETELVKILEELLTEGEYEKYEETVNVRLHMGEEHWQVENTKAIIKGVLGGLDTGDIGFDVVG